MKKKSCKTLGVVSVTLLIAVLAIGCGKKEVNNEQQNETNAEVSEKTTDTTEETNNIQAEYDSAMALYESFIAGGEKVYTNTDKHKFFKYNEEGELYDYFGDNNGLTVEEFFKQIMLSESTNGLQAPKLKNVLYSYIDCGVDGIPELALRAEFEQYEDIVTRQYVIKAYDGKLELCYEDYSYAMMNVALSETGKVTKSNSYGAGTFSNVYSYIDANGEVVYDYGVETSYTGLQILDDRFDPDLIYGNESTSSVFIKAYSFTPDQADSDSGWARERWYCVEKDDDEASNGTDFKANEAYVKGIFDKTSVELHSLEDVKTKIAEQEAKLGITNDMKEMVEIKWNTLDIGLVQSTVSEDVINNNGHFVQLNGKIYYHLVDADSMHKTALWGKYSDTEAGRTLLYEYDPLTGKNEVLYYDYSSGPISVEGDTLYGYAYLEAETDDAGVVPAVICAKSSKAGDFYKEFDDRHEILLGSNTSQTFIAAYHYSYDNYEDNKCINVYQNGVLAANHEISTYQDFVAMDNQYIYYIGGTPQTEYSLFQLDALTGESINLGILPDLEDSWNGYIDECIMSDGKIYFTYSRYEGTGNFFDRGYYVQATVGEKDSLMYWWMNPIESETGENQVAPFAIKDGEIVQSEGIPGKCDVDTKGWLGYYDEQGNWVPVADGFGYEYISDEYDYQAVELAEKVGDSIYVIYNVNDRAPQDDIGWRYAYSRRCTYIYRVDIKTGEKELLVKQLSPRGED